MGLEKVNTSENVQLLMRVKYSEKCCAVELGGFALYLTKPVREGSLREAGWVQPQRGWVGAAPERLGGGSLRQAWGRPRRGWAWDSGLCENSCAGAGYMGNMSDGSSE